MIRPRHNVLNRKSYTTLRGFYASCGELATARESIQRSRSEPADLIGRLKAGI